MPVGRDFSIIFSTLDSAGTVGAAQIDHQEGIMTISLNRIRRVSRLTVAFAFMLAAMVAFGISAAEATNTTIRVVDLLSTGGNDASGRIILQHQEFPDNSQFGGLIVDAFDLDFRGLPCRGSFDVATSEEFYVLYVNGQRLVSFNTSCGAGGGENYRTILRFSGIEQLQGWLDDPIHDDIHAEVFLQSDGVAGGTLVLEGWLEE